MQNYPARRCAWKICVDQPDFGTAGNEYISARAEMKASGGINK